MLQRFREWLTLVLIVLLPFHAFGVTVLTKILTGPGHAPLSEIAVWKEALLAFILLVSFAEIIFLLVKNKEQKPSILRPDIFDSLIIGLIILSVLVTVFTGKNTGLYLLGFKYDFIPLVTFLLLRRVDWSGWFRTSAVQLILLSATIVSTYGILTFFLPESFFYMLGYSDLHSLYVADSPIAAFQKIGGSALHRIQSTFSGPNQFGIWLLLPIALSVTLSLSKSRHASSCFDGLSMTRLALFLAALALTFSRAAWIGAAVIIAISLYPFVRHHLNQKRLLWLGFIAVIFLFIATALFPNTLLRLSSSRGHIERPIEALQKMIASPLGSGLGSAGPATNRFSDTCVMLRPEDDPSWAKEHADLCVFLGDKQVQPLDRSCNCPFLPENWYLQIGVELGWIGFIAYFALITLILLRTAGQARSLFLAFLGVSIAGLFLHAWEDAAIAYTTWVLLSYALMYGKHDTGAGHGIGSENTGRGFGA